MRLIALAALMFCAGTACAAEAYKWVDKNGVTNYGDTPRRDAQLLDVRPGSGNGPDAATAAQTAECTRQKADLEASRKATGLQEVDNLGRTHVYSEQERLQYLEAAEKRVKAACAGPAPAPAASNP